MGNGTLETQRSKDNRILIKGQKILIFLMLYQLLLPILLIIWISTFTLTDRLEMNHKEIWNLRFLCAFIQIFQLYYAWQLMKLLKTKLWIWEWTWLAIIALPILSYGELQSLYLKIGRQLEIAGIETPIMSATRNVKRVVDRKLF